MGRLIHKRQVLSNEKSITSLRRLVLRTLHSTRFIEKSCTENPVLRAEDIHRLCRLARLEISTSEVADVSAKLTSIVGLVDQLQAVDTAGVAPMAHPLDRPQRLRVDSVTETDRHELYQRNAALVERDLYLVPKVIE
jgi:aspartyl-tRNA(Asn)/glutamyl-tRNA(Gln) amidotransferase subunit C